MLFCKKTEILILLDKNTEIKMKTKAENSEKEFDTVKTFRAIKEKISKDIYKMNLEQIKEYLQNQKIFVPFLQK